MDLEADHNSRSGPPVLPSRDLRFGYLVSCWPGIVIAGTIYPLVVLATLSIVGLVSNGLPGPITPAVLGVMAFVVIAATFFGLLISLFTGAFSCVVVWLVNESLGAPLPSRLAAAAAGGLAGYSPTILLFFNGFFSLSLVFVITGFLGPILAVVMGSIGAFEYARRKVETTDEFRGCDAPQNSLTIKTMMIGTTWVAVVFGLTNAIGGLNFAATVGGWVVLQGLVLLVMARIIRKQASV